MGLGQLINRQVVKGILNLLLFVYCILYPIPFSYYCIEGLISLGWVPMQDHSLFMMVYGILGLIVLTFVLLIYITNIKDAYRNAVKLQNGETLPGFKESVSAFIGRRSAQLMISPSIIAITVIVILPLIFSIMIGFTNYDTYHQPPGKLVDWVGFKNFLDIFTIKSWSSTFLGILTWTLLWTVLSSVIPYAFGITTAVVLNIKEVRFKNFFKTVYILPFAIPGYIMLLVWRGMFDTDFGLVNSILNDFGINNVPWFQSPFFAKVSLIIVAVWSGFTFPFMLADGILKSISNDLYEAAKLDGASSFVCFRKITLPLLMFSITPMFIMGLAGAFNNFNLIYLLTGGGPANMDYQGAGSTDILISWLYKMTFNISKYNYASAISLMIFIVVGALSIYNLRKTKNYTEEDMVQ
jgi:arabinogalactan oligomer/maltooligosaccharide transport system permease protein